MLTDADSSAASASLRFAGGARDPGAGTQLQP